MATSNEYDSDDNESYPIHEAVLKGDCETILSLLEKGYNVNCANDSNETPVYLAVFYKKYDVLKLLLSQDAEPVTEGYSNPLLLATSNNDHECVEILLEYKSNPSYQDALSENLWTPLHETCHKGFTLILKKFLETKCSLNIRNEEGATPVYISCQYGQTECLRLLLDHGASGQIPVDSWHSPLNIACQEGYYDCVKTLLTHGAVNVQCSSNTDRSPLAAACFRDQYDCAKLLIEYDASLLTNHPDIDGSPIHLAARHSNVLCLGLLIENGANVNSVCKSCTPLFEAVSADNLPGCRMLLSNGADPNCVCESNMMLKTPLMAATYNSNVEIIKQLVSYGADVNQTTFTSPLMLAAKFKSCDAFKQLLSYNPDINLIDESGNSALSTLCTVLVLNYHTNEYDSLLQHCRKILIFGGDLTQLTKLSSRSPILDTMFVRMCPDLLRLLLEFATCREHIQFISTICENCTGKGWDDWEELYDFIWQPRKLAHLCRITIRNLLGVKKLERIKELPIPTILKDYLQHSNEENDF